MPAPPKAPEVAVRPDGQLIAVGHDILGWGQLAKAKPGQWIVALRPPFLLGDLGALSNFAEKFDELSDQERFVAIENEDGRCLGRAPEWERSGDVITVTFPVKPPYPREDVRLIEEEAFLDITGGKGAVLGLEYIFRALNTYLGFHATGGGSRLAELAEKLSVRRQEELTPLRH